MRTTLRVLVGMGAVALAVATAASPAHAEGPQTAAGHYCVSVLGKAPAGQESPELYRYCSTTPFDTKEHLRGADVRSQMRTALEGEGVAPAQAQVLATASQMLVVRAYSGADYTGRFWDYYANDADGHCDSAGYLWRPDSYWSTHLSSLDKNPNTYCNTATLYNRQGTASRNFGIPLHYVTSTFNDNVGRMQIFNGNGTA